MFKTGDRVSLQPGYTFTGYVSGSDYATMNKEKGTVITSDETNTIFVLPDGKAYTTHTDALKKVDVTPLNHGQVWSTNDRACVTNHLNTFSFYLAKLLNRSTKSIEWELKRQLGWRVQG